MKRKELIAVVILFAAALIFYLHYLTVSGLWYDEAVEYYNSTVLKGPLPYGNFEGNSMYDRICDTFQPPLYNVLMFFWLKIRDTEAWFRMFGVVMNLLGALAIYLTGRKLTDYRLALLGAMAYLFTDNIIYYGLECAEYNLMLCCICWMIYFFMQCMTECRRPYLVGFFITACLAVYSQYGAALLVVAMWLCMFSHCLATYKKQGSYIMVDFLIATAAVVMFAAAPMVIFFMWPQMQGQGTTDVSHAPYFATGNVFTDFFVSIYDVVKDESAFIMEGAYKWITIGIVFASMALIVAALIVKRDKMLQILASILAICWCIYYALVACSLYGYNDWSGVLGTENIGGRYALFFIPLWVVLVLYAANVIMEWHRERFGDLIWKVTGSTMLVTLGVFVVLGATSPAVDYIKDDVRGLVPVWYELNDSGQVLTVVHDWDAANFTYYMTRDEHYDPECDYNIWETGDWDRATDYDTLYTTLMRNPLFMEDEFYYICPYYDESFKQSCQIIGRIFQEEGYQVLYLYEGKSELMYFYR